MKLRALVLAIALLTALAVPAYAQVKLAASPGLITPKMGVLYQLELLFDDLMIMLSPNKPLTKLSVMEERLAEYEATKDVTALNDYMAKAASLDKDIAKADSVTETVVKLKLERHIEVLQQVKEEVPDAAKQAVEKAIEESSKSLEAVEEAKAKVKAGESKSESRSATGTHSSVSIPSSVSVGQEVTVSGVVCNPFNSTITALKIDVYVKKQGLEGIIVNRHESRTFSVEIGAGECYSKEVSFTVPEGAWGISSRGQWEVRVVITAIPQNVVVVDVTKSITVS